MHHARKIGLLTVAAILGLSGQASAQQVKPAKPDHDMREMQKAAKESRKDAMKEAKEQQKDAAKIVDDQRKAAAKTARVAHDDAARAARSNERAQHESFKAARQQSSRLTHGIRLTSAERRLFEASRKRYDAQYRALEKQERQLDKSHQSDAVVLQQLETLRLQERADLRAILTPEQQAIFDRNVSTLAKRR